MNFVFKICHIVIASFESKQNIRNFELLGIWKIRSKSFFFSLCWMNFLRDRNLVLAEFWWKYFKKFVRKLKAFCWKLLNIFFCSCCWEKLDFLHTFLAVIKHLLWWSAAFINRVTWGLSTVVPTTCGMHGNLIFLFDRIWPSRVCTVHWRLLPLSEYFEYVRLNKEF